MNDESKKYDIFQEPSFISQFWGLDMGERWGRELGSIDSRLTRVETDIQKLDAKIDTVDLGVDKCLVAISRLDERVGSIDSHLTRVETDIQKLDAKIDAVDLRVDKCLVVINRLDERVGSLHSSLTSLHSITIGLGVAILAGLILQYFK